MPSSSAAPSCARWRMETRTEHGSGRRRWYAMSSAGERIAPERWRLAGWLGGVSPLTRRDTKHLLVTVSSAARRQRSGAPRLIDNVDTRHHWPYSSPRYMNDNTPRNAYWYGYFT